MVGSTAHDGGGERSVFRIEPGRESPRSLSRGRAGDCWDCLVLWSLSRGVARPARIPSVPGLAVRSAIPNTAWSRGCRIPNVSRPLDHSRLTGAECAGVRVGSLRGFNGDNWRLAIVRSNNALQRTVVHRGRPVRAIDLSARVSAEWPLSPAAELAR